MQQNAPNLHIKARQGSAHEIRARFGVDRVVSIRASDKFRLYAHRENGHWQLHGFGSRGDHDYRSEA